MGLGDDFTEEKLNQMAQMSVENEIDDFDEGDFSEELSQLDSEADADFDFDDSEYTEMLAQINAEGEGDAEENELMFDAVAEFLAQADDSEKAELNTLVHQVLAEQYSENGNILLAQADGELKESTNEDLDAVAEFLA